MDEAKIKEGIVNREANIRSCYVEKCFKSKGTIVL